MSVPPTAEDAKPANSEVASSTTSVKQIVIIGGGIAGLMSTHYSLKYIIPSLPESASYHVTIVDPSTKFVNRVASPRSLVSEELLPISKWMLDFKGAFEQYSSDKYTLIQGKAVNLDTTARTVTIAKADGVTDSITYYALIIATGAASPTPLFSSPYAHTVTESAIRAFQAKLTSAKSIVVAGGGPAGVETAGELGHYLNGQAGWFSARPKTIKTKITLVTSSDKLIPILRPGLGKKAENLLNKVGVDVVYNAAVVSTVPEYAGRLDQNGAIGPVTEPAKITLSTGEVLEADLYIPAMGLKANTSWLPADLVDAKGKVDTNKETLRVDKAGPRVYAIGDVGNYGNGGYMDLSMGAIPVAMVNIKRDLVHDAKVLTSGDEKTPITGKDSIYTDKVGETQMVPVGRSTGVAAMFGWKMPGFMVWLIKGRQYMTEMNGWHLTGKMVSEAKWKDM